MPKVDKLVLLPMPEPTTRLAALRSGQVDWIEVSPPDSITPLKGQGFQIVMELAESPKHPYTQALFASAPSMDPAQRIAEPPLTGDPPNPLSPPSGCRFRTRCPFATSQCAELVPPLLEVAPRHFAACHLYTTN